ncbi:penicillin-binding protein [soil metagenome]
MAIRATKRKKRDLRAVAFTRFMMIVALFVLWIGGIGVRLVYLQVSQHAELRKKAVGQRRDVRQSKMLRGSIFDRNQRALAISLRVQTLYADATQLDDISATARLLSETLKLKEIELRHRLEEARSLQRRFVPIAHGLDSTAVDEVNRALESSDVRKADMPRYKGLHWREDQKRSYPNNSLAAHIIGFSNNAGVGQAGIEQSQNDVLYGAVIRRTRERDRLGRVYDEVVTEKEPANDIILTIDATTQFAVESALAKAVKNSNAASGMAIVIANKTGEILAMANYPTFDPNDLGGITKDNLSNGSIQKMYSPGSVFKLVTYGAALERDLISPSAEIDTGNGTIEIAKRKFRDSRALGRVSYTKAMAVSSNVSAIKTGVKVGKENFYSTIKDFGFGRPTGIELPAETAGIVRPTERWFGDSLASMSIGYEIGVSPLQMATAFATIANNGVRVQPHLIKEIRQSDETIVSVTRPEKTQVVRVETARGLREMLREVVVSGTGKQAQVAGYSTSGKTGTAWKFDEKLKRVNAAKYMSSFMGFAPANDPEVTIAVVIDEPKVGGRGGGSVAAPVFREIAEQILPDMDIRPDLDSNGSLLASIDVTESPEIPESVGNGEEVSAGSGPNPDPGETEATVPEPKKVVGKMPSREPETADKKKKPLSEPKTTVKAERPRTIAETKETDGSKRNRIETKPRN